MTSVDWDEFRQSLTRYFPHMRGLPEGPDELPAWAAEWQRGLDPRHVWDKERLFATLYAYIHSGARYAPSAVELNALRHESEVILPKPMKTMEAIQEPEREGATPLLRATWGYLRARGWLPKTDPEYTPDKDDEEAMSTWKAKLETRWSAENSSYRCLTCRDKGLQVVYWDGGGPRKDALIVNEADYFALCEDKDCEAPIGWMHGMRPCPDCDKGNKRGAKLKPTAIEQEEPHWL